MTNKQGHVFHNNTVVFHEDGLKLLIEADRGGLELFDGMGSLYAGVGVLEKCRPVNVFNFRVATYLYKYKTQMSQAKVLNSTTSNALDTMVLDFIDTYNSWTDDVAKKWNHLYEYKDRLIAKLEEYNSQVEALR